MLGAFVWRKIRGRLPRARAAAVCGENFTLNLFIAHYHFRPGGVRRVIELAAPDLARELGAQQIVLLSGERPPAEWLCEFRKAARPAEVRVCTHAALGYAEQPVQQSQVRLALERALRGSGVVWAHNLALGRNLMLSREIAGVCAERELPLISHHHDWWCDRRWSRWPAIRRAGFGTMHSVASAILPTTGKVAHVAINLADAGILQKAFGAAAHWVPNPIERNPPPRRRAVTTPPVWLLPCRVLRRKNIAEALLLTRWLRPEATLVVTGGADEPDEQHYAKTLADAAREHSWPLQLDALRSRKYQGATVGELMAAAEAIVFTSIQEGFGLPQLEAAAADRPALVRCVPQVAPDLARLGFRFPQSYGEIVIPPELFDWSAEVRRQSAAFRAWRNLLPRSIRHLATTPTLLAKSRTPHPTAFARLTLTAQLEVLRHAPTQSWKASVSLNPFLTRWRELAARGQLAATKWPRTADRQLSAAAYARRLVGIARGCSEAECDPRTGRAAQDEFIRARLDRAEMFPLLWSPR